MAVPSSSIPCGKTTRQSVETLGFRHLSWDTRLPRHTKQTWKLRTVIRIYSLPGALKSFTPPNYEHPERLAHLVVQGLILGQRESILSTRILLHDGLHECHILCPHSGRGSHSFWISAPQEIDRSCVRRQSLCTRAPGQVPVKLNCDLRLLWRLDAQTPVGSNEPCSNYSLGHARPTLLKNEERDEPASRSHFCVTHEQIIASQASMYAGTCNRDIAPRSKHDT